ncbi:hypothetical protein [Dactylosporangium sp. NPDC048998]|uniref:hypothetical protein n=1 Tax=Dactylosporangium sp. NPDC048998 TaxID=3363976 RepID=UPI003716CA50
MTDPAADAHDRSPVIWRRLGWASLAAAIAATIAVVPPLVLPSAAPSPPSKGPSGAPSEAPSAAHSSLPAAPPVPAFRAISLHAADDANLRKGARVIDCPSCDGGRRVGYIGGPNTLAIRVADVPAAGDRTLVIVYETQDPRTLMVTVNDGPVHTMSLSGAGDYLIPATASLRVYLPAGTSWIRFFNDAGPAPDINRIELR